MSKPKATPMIQQYLSIKEKYPDAILFYRMGDFYEMFFEDAHAASRVLEIALTSRNKNDAVPVPMCGVPHKAAQTYISRLIEAGHKVAICDQVEDPAEAKGLVKRDVVRVVTPGMIIENELLEAKAHNFLLALAVHRESIGLSYLDISTGTFRVTETADGVKILEEIQRIGPREILLPAALKNTEWKRRIEMRVDPKSLNWLGDGAFDPRQGEQRLIEQFQTLTLEGFGCHDMKAGLGAAGALLHYVAETQKQSVQHFHGIETYFLDHHLIIDHLSSQNLELEKNIRSGSKQGTLMQVLDKTSTAMGGRRLRQWVRYPLLSATRIGQRLDAVEEALCQSGPRQEMMTALDGVYDLERLNSKLGMGHANARDLVSLKKSIQALPAIWQTLDAFRSDLFLDRPPLDTVLGLAQSIDAAIREDAPPTVQEGGMIKVGYNAELDALIGLSRDGKGYLASLEIREKEATGISTLKVRFNKVFGYYIEIPKSQAGRAPDHYVRKQTLVNAERYITDELKQYETKVLGAEDRRCSLELDIFNQIREQVRESSAEIQRVADFIANLDCLLGLAEVADHNDYSRPQINTQGVIDIKDGRHPVVEKMIRNERFVPNTVRLDNATDQILIITGPNMAGKSTILRQVALLVIMAQIGSFVPAAAADIAITDRIFTRVGALDNLSSGQSTFMVEMEETANILNNATADSLIVMDEIGRGTSTYDGLSIAWAVVEYLHDLKASGVKTLFATHYHELIELAQSRARVQNFNIAVKEWNDKIIFLRKLVPGGTNRSYGIQVARLAGIPDGVIRRSKVILNRIENHAPEGARVADTIMDPEGKGDRPVQLDLFKSAEKKVMEELAGIDIHTTTPMEALQLLMELQGKAKSGTLG
jgi:DNA mismatch repair protein MutS